MGQELSGKVAIVTGAANGLGRATAELFLAEGAKVVIGDIDPRGQELADKLGGAARFKRTDVSKADEMQALIDFAVAEFGGLHIMVNNAGISDNLLCRFLDADLSHFDKVMGVNLFSVMAGSQRAAKHMAKNGGGTIINVSSIGGAMPSFSVPIYRASKAGIIQFTKSIAIDLAEYGIRVNCLMPGNIATTIIAASLAPGVTPEQGARLEKGIREVTMSFQPLKRHGTPKDVAEAALYLASDRSAQITGIVLPVDGGVTIGDFVNHLEQLLKVRTEVLGS